MILVLRRLQYDDLLLLPAEMIDQLHSGTGKGKIRTINADLHVKCNKSSDCVDPA